MLRDQTRVKAAMFEAHVGGLYEQARWRCGVRGTHGQAIDEVDIWLRGIYLPLATWARRSLEEMRAEVDESSEAQTEIDIWRMAEGATANSTIMSCAASSGLCPRMRSTDRIRAGLKRHGERSAGSRILKADFGSEHRRVAMTGPDGSTSIGSGRSVLSSKGLAALKACQEMGLS